MNDTSCMEEKGYSDDVGDFLVVKVGGFPKRIFVAQKIDPFFIKITDDGFLSRVWVRHYTIQIPETTQVQREIGELKKNKGNKDEIKLDTIKVTEKNFKSEVIIGLKYLGVTGTDLKKISTELMAA